MGKKTVAERGYPLVKVLCCDEIALHKGHGNYRLVLYAPELGIVLDMLVDRLKETLEQWFDQRGLAWCAHVEVFCADMWDAYHEAATAKLPNAKQTADHFHIIKNLNDAISKTRRMIQKEADANTQAILKGSRWLLLKNPDALSAKDKLRLQACLDASPALKTCYELKQAFQQWMNTEQSPQAAAPVLDDWLRKVYATSYQALHAFADMVTRWRSRILHFFEGRHTNAFAEGVNLKIKLILRRGFGFPNFEHFRLRILVAFSTSLYPA